MTARSLAARPARIAMRGYVGARTRAWPDDSRLFAVGERTSWSVDEDARHLEATARRLGYEVAPSGWARFAADQAVFLTSHFEALQPRWLETSHRLGTAYLHGRPGTPGYPEFDRAYETLRPPGSVRRDPGDARRDARARRRGGRRAGLGPRDPHRDRSRALPAGRRRATHGVAGSARRPSGRVRRRLVPEGRRRVGGGARAEARQGPRRARLRTRARRCRGGRSARAPDGACARLRPA